MPDAITARCPVVTVVFVFIHADPAGQSKAVGHRPFIFRKQCPAPASQFIQTICRFQLVAGIAQFFITILTAQRQGMGAEEDLVLVIEDRVVRLHFATRVVGLFLLDIAGGVELIVIAAVG